jgi:hypothetical protein
MDDMQAALRSINIDSAAGPDGIPLRLFRLLDGRNLLLLRDVFEETRRSGQIPTDWKQSRLTLIYKAKDPADVANWRPITVQKSITLLFTKILAQRLLRLMWQLRVIPMTQKCNVQNISGVNEHSFLLRAMLEDMQTKARLGVTGAELIIIFTDVAKAFDSIQRGTLLDMLPRVLGQVEPFAKLLGDLYKDVTLILTDAEGLAVQIPKRGGIHQGDAMSALLYILVARFADLLKEQRDQAESDASLTELQADNHTTTTAPTPGYIFLGDTAAHYPCTEMSYEDDRNVVAGGVKEAQTNLSKIAAGQAADVNLFFNAAKTTVLALRVNPANKQVEAFDPRLRLDGVYLRALSLHEPVRSLGLTVTGDGSTAAGSTLACQRFIDAVTKLDQSVLDATRKIALLRMVAIAGLEHHFSNTVFAAADLDDLDKMQRNMVRKWLGANTILINDAFLRAPLIDGGLAIYNIRERWEVLYLSAFAHMTCAHDPVTRHAAWSLVHTSQLDMTWQADEKSDNSKTRDCFTSPERLRLLTEASRSLSTEAAKPPFFGWARLPAGQTGDRSGSGGTARPALQYARLAKKWGVGFFVPGVSHALSLSEETSASATTHIFPPKAASRETAGQPPLRDLVFLLDGEIVDGPFKLTQKLLDKMTQQYREDLVKLKVVAGKIEAHQGISYLPLQHTIRFTRSYLSPTLIRYSDAETSIILKAQLDLWPTASKLHTVMPTKVTSPECVHCRCARETVSHLLSLPQNGSPLSPLSLMATRRGMQQPATAASASAIAAVRVSGSHPEPLASMATSRHNQIVHVLVDTLRTLKEDRYSCIIEEMKLDTIVLEAPDITLNGPGTQHFDQSPHTLAQQNKITADRDRLRRLHSDLTAALRELRNGSVCHNGRRLSHTKPDILVVFETFVPRRPQNPATATSPCDTDSESTQLSKTPVGNWERRAFIVDVVCTADEYALAEHDVGLMTLCTPATLEQFDDMGWNSVDPINGMISVQDKRSPAKQVPVFCRYSPYISKLKKYDAIAGYLLERLQLNSCTVLPLVFGVRGFVSSATVSHLAKLLSPRQVLTTAALTRTLMHRIMHIIFTAIVRIYRSWKQLSGTR